MFQAIAIAAVLLLVPCLALAIALGWLWWRAEDEAIMKVLDSSLDHIKDD